MGHSVGDAADRATRKGQAPQATKERTTEKVIADIRNNRASGLHVPASDVDVLLAEYDNVLASIPAKYIERPGISVPDGVVDMEALRAVTEGGDAA